MTRNDMDRRLLLKLILIVLLAAVAAGIGILSNEPSGLTTILSVRGKEVALYGKGIYRHMSTEVAIQGIAQDYVTIFLALPSLIASYLAAIIGSIRGRLVLSGTVFYLFVTYLFYLMMAEYNYLFLIYVVLLGLTFFSFISLFMPILRNEFQHTLAPWAPVKSAGYFLIGNSTIIGMLWLSVIVPPLFDRSIYPLALDHYTTLVVQGLDLALLLPIGFTCGTALRSRTNFGILGGIVYLVFLSILMIALIAKIAFMGFHGYNTIPAIVIIPTLAIIALSFAFFLLRAIRTEKT